MEIKDREKLKAYMTIQDLTHRALADGAGLHSHTYIGRLARGTATTAKPETAARISLYLGIAIDDLWVARTSQEAQQAVATYESLKTDRALRKAVAA